MEYNEILKSLKEMSSEKHKSNVVRMGIPEENSMGVSIKSIRKIAKTLPFSNKLAYELWETDYHEAKLLAVLIFDEKIFSIEQVEKIMEDVFSWDLCDHLCKNLIVKIDGYEVLIDKWCTDPRVYFKRASFTLMTSKVLQNNFSDETIYSFLEIIKKESDDDRNHVKKAISWALREIGKTDFNNQEKAIFLARELKQSGNKAQTWIAKNALKELESLVKVDERKRLISNKTKMGKQI